MYFMPFIDGNLVWDPLGFYPLKKYFFYYDSITWIMPHLGCDIWSSIFYDNKARGAKAVQYKFYPGAYLSYS